MKKINKICLILKNNNDWVGGSQYIKNILFSFAYLDKIERKSVELHLITFDKDLNNFEYRDLSDYFYSYASVNNKFLKEFLLKYGHLKFIEYFFISFILVKNKINFVFPFPNLLNKFGIKSALWIPDFQHHYLKSNFTKKEFLFRNKKFNKILKNTSNVVLSSIDAKKDLLKFYGKTKKKITILNFRSDINFHWLNENPYKTVQKYNLPKKFMIVSNQFWKHKNHILVFEALSYLKIKKNITPHIVFTGRLFNNDHEYLDQILIKIHELNISKQISILGLIAKKDQFNLMRQSISIIQPSLFEGWSTIVEEARSIGKNIILSDLEVHKEQNYSNSIFFKRNSYKDLAKKIEKVLENCKSGPDLFTEKNFSAKNSKLMKDFVYNFIKLSNSI